MTKFSTLVFTAFIGLSANSAYAHSEHDKARFVSTTGQDTGFCDNVFRPCKTIAYAAQQANKGDKILLSSGQYDVSSLDDIFYLKSSVVPVYGGYNKYDHFQTQSPQINITTLTNVPANMVKELRQRGFNVINDGKGFTKDIELQQLLKKQQQTLNASRNISCENGLANSFECENIDLMSFTPLVNMTTAPSEASDIWGHVDLNNHREYAIIAVSNGTVVFDVTNPRTPVEVGTVRGVESAWRDVKVYQYYDQNAQAWQAYAYVTTEGTNGQIQIVDLNSLPNSVHEVGKSGVARTAHNIYISNLDHSLNIANSALAPIVQIVGSNRRSGSFQNFSIESPKVLNELFEEVYSDNYTHDGTSLLIDDHRAFRDCGVAQGSCSVFIDFSENMVRLWNNTDPKKVKALSEMAHYDVSFDKQYIHSGWGTEDKRYILVHDEFDESRGRLNTSVRVYSIDDLTAPQEVGKWTGPTRAIDHNGYVRGNRYYMSNYTKGLTILDISDPTSPKQVGYFDTFTLNDNSSFNGAWGVYPYLPSGNILVSDMNTGLYILKDNTKSQSDNSISFSSKHYATAQNTNLLIDVERNSASVTEQVSVHYQVISGSATNGSDFTLSDGTLQWDEDDNTNKTIDIPITAARGEEASEKFFIRLFNPSSNATLGAHSYTTIVISGFDGNGSASFEKSEMLVAESNPTAEVSVNRIGVTTGELAFNYQLSSDTATIGEDVEQLSGQLFWADGDSATKKIEVSLINDELIEADEQFTLTLTPIGNSRLGVNESVTFTIADDENNTAPVVTLSENFEVNAGQQVQLVATTTDAESDTMKYMWQQSNGTSVTIENVLADETSFVAPNNASVLTFSFTATDFRGSATTESVQITVVDSSSSDNKNSSSGGGSAWYLLFSAFVITLRQRYLAKAKHHFEL